jgi:hypothetical protein
LDQLCEISPVQRQLAHLNLIDERTHGRIRCLDLIYLAFHGHGLLRQPDCKRKADDALAADSERYSFAQYGREAFLRCPYFVFADSQIRYVVPALSVAYDRL